MLVMRSVAGSPLRVLQGRSDLLAQSIPLATVGLTVLDDEERETELAFHRHRHEAVGIGLDRRPGNNELRGEVLCGPAISEELCEQLGCARSRSHTTVSYGGTFPIAI